MNLNMVVIMMTDLKKYGRLLGCSILSSFLMETIDQREELLLQEAYEQEKTRREG